MTKKITILIGLILTFLTLKGQQERLESDRFIYWQPDCNLRFEDFKKKIDSEDIELCKKNGVQSLPKIQILSILDCPQKKSKITGLKEKYYFSPVFCKDSSLKTGNDTSELKYARLYFDIAECCVRNARRKIADEKEEEYFVNGYLTESFQGIVNDMCESMGKMFRTFTQEVIITKTPGAYEKWRSDCDKLLLEIKEYATTKEECSRFINKVPFSSDYYRELYVAYGKAVKKK